MHDAMTRMIGHRVRSTIRRGGERREADLGRVFWAPLPGSFRRVLAALGGCGDEARCRLRTPQAMLGGASNQESWATGDCVIVCIGRGGNSGLEI
jgi:hypothetical protein